MKLLYRLVIVLAVCLIAIPILAVPVEVNAQGGGITLDPEEGRPGEQVTVTGENFTDEEDVDIYYYFNGTKEKVGTKTASSAGRFTFKFTIPESYSGAHEIQAKGDDNDVSADFTVQPGLAIDPEEGSVDTTVTVKGTGFAEDEDGIEVRFYTDGSDYEIVDKDIKADENGSWELEFEVPDCSAGEHKIDATGDDSSLSEVEDVAFTMKAGISLSKTSGYVGDTVTVKGSGFDGDETRIEVTFDAIVVVEDIEADETGSWEAIFTVPNVAKGDHKVDASGRETKASAIADKVFTTKLLITLTPAEGNVGTSIAVGGSGFATGKQVTINYDGSQVATDTADSQGKFEGVTFAATHKQSVHTVEHPVEVKDAAGNLATINFVMESVAPPRPVLSKPADGSRVGFILGKSRPTFKWSAVTDDSGVSYSLQIATSEDFTTPVVDLTGLTGASYTLTKDEALARGTYYWRVKAIDGAQNDSGWTAAYSLNSGLFPLWLSIVIIVVIVAFIVFLVYRLAMKRTRYYE